MAKDLLKLKFKSLKQQELRCANSFLKSQWTRNTSTNADYLLYRLWHLCCVIGILLLSLLDVGKPWQGMYHYIKWPIYLTNWGHILNVMQGGLSAFIVCQAYTNANHVSDEPAQAPRMSRLFHIYWRSHSCAVTIAFGITTMYWLFIYNPELYELDASNVASHFLNAVIMGIDFLVAGHPFELVHAVFPLFFVTAYIAFNFLYYISGGLSRKGTVTLYEAMDWRKPVTCLKFLCGGYIVVTLVHLFFFVVYMLKKKLALNIKLRQYSRNNSQNPIDDDTLV